MSSVFSFAFIAPYIDSNEAAATTNYDLKDIFPNNTLFVLTSMKGFSEIYTLPVI